MNLKRNLERKVVIYRKILTSILLMVLIQLLGTANIQAQTTDPVVSLKLEKHIFKTGI